MAACEDEEELLAVGWCVCDGGGEVGAWVRGLGLLVALVLLFGEGGGY